MKKVVSCERLDLKETMDCSQQSGKGLIFNKTLSRYANRRTI